MSLATYVLVGITAVFSIFVVLYTIFRLMEFLSRDSKTKQKKSETAGEKKTVEKHDDTHIAIISAVINEIFGEPVKIKSIHLSKNYSFDDRTVQWRRYGWKGARRWRASSGW